MQKTMNYNLNQWDPTDPIRREDFNADTAAIDAALAAAYSENNLPWEMGTLTLVAVPEGTVVKTFNFVPSAIFVSAQTMLGGMATNGNAARVTRSSDTTSYCLLQLSGNTLTMTKLVGASFGTLQYVALK